MAEIARVLPSDRWTIVGGLMTQLNTIRFGIGVVRPTNDIDIVLHVETARGAAHEVAIALQSLGYELRAALDPRSNTAHRFVRDRDVVDLVTSRSVPEEMVDVLVADHAAPRVVERLMGHEMVRLEGGTQALRRTVDARLQIEEGATTTVSVPRPFGALILKAAAYRSDSRARDRHLRDAAALLACIEDPIAERDGFAGSDRRRIEMLRQLLHEDHFAWLTVPEGVRADARAALRLLSTDT